jgi:hypothetical protein
MRRSYAGKQRIWTQAEPQRGRQAPPTLTAKGKADAPRHLVEAQRAPGVWRDDAGQTLDKDLAGAFRGEAEKAPDMEVEAHGHAAPRQGRSATRGT